MKLLSAAAILAVLTFASATYYAVIPSAYIGGFAYPHTVPVGYTYTAPATTTFVKYVQPEPVAYALAYLKK